MHIHFKSVWSFTGVLKGLLTPKFANKGDSQCSNKEAAYIQFVDFMDGCEGNSHCVILYFDPVLVIVKLLEVNKPY